MKWSYDQVIRGLLYESEVICCWKKKPFHTQSLSEKNEGKNALKEIGENGENTLCNTGL